MPRQAALGRISAGKHFSKVIAHVLKHVHRRRIVKRGTAAAAAERRRRRASPGVSRNATLKLDAEDRVQAFAERKVRCRLECPLLLHHGLHCLHSGCRRGQAVLSPKCQAIGQCGGAPEGGGWPGLKAPRQ